VQCTWRPSCTCSRSSQGTAQPCVCVCVCAATVRASVRLAHMHAHPYTSAMCKRRPPMRHTARPTTHTAMLRLHTAHCHVEETATNETHSEANNTHSHAKTAHGTQWGCGRGWGVSSGAIFTHARTHNRHQLWLCLHAAMWHQHMLSADIKRRLQGQRGTETDDKGPCQLSVATWRMHEGSASKWVHIYKTSSATVRSMWQGVVWALLSARSSNRCT
jgi:hypothetical protein